MTATLYATAQQALAAASHTAVAPLVWNPAAHLLSRFSFGATGADRSDATVSTPDVWWANQVALGQQHPGYSANPTVAAMGPMLSMNAADIQTQLTALGRAYGWDALDQLNRVTMGLQMYSPAQLYETVVDFFANHLNITCYNGDVWNTRHIFDRDVVRANAFGKYSDMLVASGRSSAMLYYLNQSESKKTAVNENYGRELLELHTVGLVYSEADVKNSAAIMTGRIVNWQNWTYQYDPTVHATGPVTVLGFSNANATAAGGEQAPALLRRVVRRELQHVNLDFHAAHLDVLASALASGVTHHLTLPAGRDLSVIGGPFPRLELPRPATSRPASALSPGGPRPDFTFPPDWTLRHRRDGDRIRLGGGERKVSDVLSDLRVPRAERDGLWLLAAPGGVQWLGTQPPTWALGAREQVSGPPPSSAEPNPSNPNQPEADHHFMGEALALAGAAAQRGEVPVGALVVCGGVVVASAANRSRELGDMTRHAELGALRQAARVVGPYLSGCTLYVTLEPCPMCLGAAIEARLGRLVYGAANPRAGALGGVSDLLAHAWGHSLSVTPGVRAAQAARLLKSAFAGFRAAAP